MILRPYQTDFVNGALALWRNGDRRIAGVMATGGGKTPTAMSIAKLSIEAGLPALWLAHRTELIDQAIDKAQQVAPDVRIGRLQGTTKQHLAQLVVGSIQTASTPTSLALLRMRRWGLIVVDETHHVAAATYQRVLRDLGAYDSDGPLVLGVTATLDRSDGLSLGDTFQSVVEPKVGLIDLVRAGWLVPPRGIRVRIAELDLSRVRRTGGDLNAGQLGAAMTASMAPQRIVEAWTEHAKGRPTVAFLPTKAVSAEQAQAFIDAGYRAAHLDDRTSPKLRAAVMADFAEGAYDVVCNVGLFTEGTDLPFVSCVILKMTSSGTLYQQMVGRGLRIHPDKRDCIILDPTGVTGRHKLATLASLNGAPVAGDIPDDLLMYEEDLTSENDAEIEDTQTDTAPPEYVDGDLAHEMIDLFGQSHSAWLRTRGGTWFLPAGPGFVYLARAGVDRYDLCWATGDPRGAQRVGWDVIQAGMEIGYAMAAGDEYVAARPIWQTDRNAPWRSMRVRGGRTKGELADEKAVQRASTVLDGVP